MLNVAFAEIRCEIQGEAGASPEDGDLQMTAATAASNIKITSPSSSFRFIRRPISWSISLWRSMLRASRYRDSYSSPRSVISLKSSSSLFCSSWAKVSACRAATAATTSATSSGSLKRPRRPRRRRPSWVMPPPTNCAGPVSAGGGVGPEPKSKAPTSNAPVSNEVSAKDATYGVPRQRFPAVPSP